MVVETSCRTNKTKKSFLLLLLLVLICHVFSSIQSTIHYFITRRFVAVSSQYAEKIKRINEGCMAAH